MKETYFDDLKDELIQANKKIQQLEEQLLNANIENGNLMESINRIEWQLKESISILSSFNEYREATDRKETSKSNTKWHTYERILYDLAESFLADLNKYNKQKELKNGK